MNCFWLFSDVWITEASGSLHAGQAEGPGQHHADPEAPSDHWGRGQAMITLVTYDPQAWPKNQDNTWVET